MTNQKNGLKTEEAINNDKNAITELDFVEGKTTFDQDYTATKGLHKKHIKIQYTPTLRAIFTLANYPNLDGLVFHFGFNPNTKCLSYLIGPGTKSGNQFTPSPIPNLFGSEPGYLEVSDSSLAIVPRRVSEFTALTKDYWCNILRSNRHINTIPNHSRMVFHPRTELIDFDSEYNYISTPYLYFYHGAKNDENGAENIRPHSLMIRFGNDVGPVGIDNINYLQAPYNGTRYTKKAFNIGQLCPPGCNEADPICT